MKKSTNFEETSARLNAIIEHAIDGIITIDENGIIEDANPATGRIFGYKKKELVGENVSILMPEPDSSLHDTYIQQYLDTGIRKIIGIGREVKGKKKDGSTFPFKLSVSEVVLPDRRLFTGVIHDISSEKKAEEKLQRFNNELEKIVEARTKELGEVVNKLLDSNRKLEVEIRTRKDTEHALKKSEADLKASLAKERELNELKSRFVSMASHEFRTPLSTILSSASLIARYDQGDQQEKRQKHIDRIRSNVTHLNGILYDFLHLGKIEEGQFHFVTENVDLNVLCSEIVDELKGLFKSGQRVELLHGDEVIMFHSDRRMLKQIFSNLLSNGIKYSHEDGVITCKMTKKNNELTVQVIDQGIGISEVDQKHMFQRFFRAQNALNISGTGLGLNIVKRYLDFLGGSITFRSQLGEGTTFIITIPEITNDQ